MTTTEIQNDNTAEEIKIKFKDGVDSIPKSGGEIPYLITFACVDFNDFFKEYDIWSAITLPGGQQYSLSRKRKIFLRPGEEALSPAPRVFIPSWFPAGEYTLTLHIEDREGSAPVVRTSSLTLTKLD